MERRAHASGYWGTQDGRGAGDGGAAAGEVALDADFAGLAELGLPGMSLPLPGAADVSAALLSGPPHSLAFPPGVADVTGFAPISMSSPMRPGGFGGSDSSEIKHIPRNFSLSDLGPEMGLDHLEQLPPASKAAPALPDGLELPSLLPPARPAVPAAAANSGAAAGELGLSSVGGVPDAPDCAVEHLSEPMNSARGS